MRYAPRSVAVVVMLVFVAICFAESIASAQCPPGTRWSNRYWACVPAGPRRPPPPFPYAPPPGRRSCNISYQNCLMVCQGVPQCVNNCNVGYYACTGGS